MTYFIKKTTSETHLRIGGLKQRKKKASHAAWIDTKSYLSACSKLYALRRNASWLE